MNSATVLLRLGLVAIVLAALPVTAFAASKGTGYQTGFTRWTGGDFGAFTLKHVTVVDGKLALDATTAETETDPGGMYNGGSYQVGEAESLPFSTAFGFSEAIASWNATTPSGTWIEVLLQARYGTRWTKYYNMGVWAADDGTIHRHSVQLQGNADGYVAVDTLMLSAKKTMADGLRIKVRLFSANGAVPEVEGLAVAYNTSSDKKAMVSTGAAVPTLEVPACSQMIYPDGGNVWCSPTSTSMVLGYWGVAESECEPRVRDAVAGVYDWVYDGHGNWPFNTAYAASKGLEAYVVRYTGLDKVEPWVEAGVPVVVSYAWKKGQLTNAPIESSSGHLGVIVGFDAAGNPVVNDPAASSDAEVRRTYLRSEFEPLWLGNSGGTVYLIYQPGWSVPNF